MNASKKFGKMLEAMVGSTESDAELWRKGYRAFHDCLPYGDMQLGAERYGWEAARSDTLRQGQEIVKRGLR